MQKTDGTGLSAVRRDAGLDLQQQQKEQHVPDPEVTGNSPGSLRSILPQPWLHRSFHRSAGITGSVTKASGSGASTCRVT